MPRITDPVAVDMESMGQEDFAAMYCADEAVRHCNDCEECQRSGACCLTCRFRRDCINVCRFEKTRVKLDALSVEDFCQKLRDHDEHLMTFVAAERIRTAENRVADLIENRVNKCLSCEKLDFAVRIVELNGHLENIRNLIEIDRKTRRQTMNEWLGKYNIPYNCGWRDAIDKIIAGEAVENHD